MAEALDKLDPRAMVTSSREFAIAGKKWSVECFCQSDIRGIISGEVMAQFPYPWQRFGMRVSVK